ncbi:MAG: hypothetical protein QG635_829 [Bacteroidota bacterium]|nr:hypothetical protein [Bacteroidota bacterium]
MNTINKIILITISAIFVHYTALSQGGSNYSIFGIGDIESSPGAIYEGLAGTSVAMPLDAGINSKNPALWSYTTNTRLQAGYKFNQHYIYSDQSSIQQNNGRVSGILGLFAVDTSMGLAVSFGLYPYSNISYKIANPISFTQDQTSVAGQTTFTGNGGMSRVHLGFSLKPADNLSFGAMIFKAFGSSNLYTENVFFTSEFSSQNIKTDKYNSWGFRLGGLYSPLDGLSFGTFYEYNANLNVDSRILYHYTSSYLSDTTFDCAAVFTMPDQYGLGVSYKTGEFIIGSDISYQDFTSFGYQQGTKSQFQGNIQYSVGITKIPNRRARTLLELSSYNIGFGFKQQYYKINGISIDEIFGSIGLSIPLPGSAMLNTALVAGKRGTQENGLLKEYYGRLVIDFSIGEAWFKPFRKD